MKLAKKILEMSTETKTEVVEGLSGNEIEAVLKKANVPTILDMLADAVEGDNKKMSDFLSKASEKAVKLEK